MEEAAGKEQDHSPISSRDAGMRHAGPENLTEQSIPPKEEIISSSPSPDEAGMRSAHDVTDQPDYSDAGEDYNAAYPYNAHANHEPTYLYGGGYTHYLNADSLQVLPPVVYNDNPSVLYHTAYGFNPEMAYGHYSPVATPSSLLVDGQIYPQQFPFTQHYFPQPVAPSVPPVSSAAPSSQTELLAPVNRVQGTVTDNMVVGPGSGYFMPFGSFCRGDLPGNSAFYNFQGECTSGKPLSDTFSPLTSPAAYPQPIGILGPYNNNIGQRQMPGFGLVSGSSTESYGHGGFYQNSNFINASTHMGANDKNRLVHDKSRRRERDRDSIFTSKESHDMPCDRTRGPRASKPKGKSTAEEGSSTGRSKNSARAFGISFELCSLPDFFTDYNNAKFFVIKSFSEDNVHKSIKYNVWASTALGNRKLDAAFHEAKEMKGICPVFLLFSVNASSQFCGVAEMVGPVDFEKNADYWQQDRWSGQFPVKWHIIKDVPNSRMRHIVVESNDNKPVTHSRDTQEVNLEQGVEMLKIFKNHNAHTSILDDFGFYDEREQALHERRARQRASSNIGVLFTPSSNLAATIDEAPVSHVDKSPSTTDAPVSAVDSINQLMQNFTTAFKLEENCPEKFSVDRL